MPPDIAGLQTHPGSSVTLATDRIAVKEFESKASRCHGAFQIENVNCSVESTTWVPGQEALGGIFPAGTLK